MWAEKFEAHFVSMTLFAKSRRALSEKRNLCVWIIVHVFEPNGEACMVLPCLLIATCILNVLMTEYPSHHLC